MGEARSARVAEREGPSTIEQLLTVKSAPPHVIVLTAMASYLAIGLAVVAGWPSWGIVIAAVLPWVFIFSTELAWTYRNFHWLALFYVLVVSQGGHFVEHAVQMVQIHIQDKVGPEARGIFGNLDVEWVHFAWNTWVGIAVIALLVRYRRNPWLWVTLVIAGWHEVEHTYLIWQYAVNDINGSAGLLAKGGAIGGGLWLKRPDLHFIYNVLETIPLMIAFGWTLRRTYNDWLAKALPHAGADVLIETTRRATTERYAEGAEIVRQGDVADMFFVVVRGEVEASARDDSGAIVATRRLGPGEFFGEIGLLTDQPTARTATVSAVTSVEVLCLDRSAFRELVANSQATAEDLARTAMERAGRPASTVDLAFEELSVPASDRP